MNTDYLKEFEEMNHTTESVFDSGFNGVLIILKDGTNLTSWSEVEDSDDILYISADFRWKENYNEFKTFRNAKAVIIQNYTFPRQSLGSLFSNPPLIFKLSHLDSLESFYAINWDTSELNRSNDLFAHCYSLEYVYLENWDMSNVENFWGMFVACTNLKVVEGVENWDLSSAVNMESMFESCISLEDISFLSNWDMSNVENIFEMFRDCYSLKDASCLNWNFGNLKKGDNLFANCRSLEKLPNWYDEEFINQFGIREHLNNIEDESFIYRIARGIDPQDIFIAVGYLVNERYLIELLNDSSTHYYAKRAALLNPNLKDSEILERYVQSDNDVERAYAIENPNFKNVGILRRIAREDKEMLVRIKAQYKLNELEEAGIEIIEDYVNEFKEAFENEDIERASLVLSQWKGYDCDDANYMLAQIILDSLRDDGDFTWTFELYLEAFKHKPKIPSLLDWFNSTAIKSMEKRVEEDIGFSEMFNNMYKSNDSSNTYAKDFLDLFLDLLENDRLEELGLLYGLVDSWEENFPYDANMHCAYVILNMKRISEDELEGRIAKANELTPQDKNSYPKLLTLMNAVSKANKHFR